MDIVVDPEFERLIPPLSEQELRQLECSLLDDGALSPLVVWAPHNILLDGHHRMRLCRRHGIPFTTAGLEFESRDAARLWIIGHQLGRRNLPPEEVAYFRGGQYQKAEKLQGARSDLTPAESPGIEGREPSQDDGQATSGQGDTKSARDTSKRLGEEFGVSPSTIKRDAKFAEALDVLAEILGIEFRSDVLAGTSGLSKSDIVALSKKPRGKLAAAAHDRDKLRELVRARRKPRRNLAPPAPSAEQPSPELVSDSVQDHHDALVNILWVCGQKEEALDGLRGQLEQIAGIAREALGLQVERIETAAGTGAPLVTDEDLL